MDARSISAGRLYADLARLWPIISPPEDYAEEAEHWKAVLREFLGPGRHCVMELGAGGGHNLSHLTDEFDAVAVDRSHAMLELSRRRNPGVEHVPGDMRRVRLGRRFDAVLIHDAISYLLCEEELRATFGTAAAHLEPGGLLVIAPDDYRETFEPPRIDHSTHEQNGTRVTMIEFAHDPDPDDTTFEVLYTFFIEEHGGLRIEHDRHTLGLFPRQTWRELMAEAGFGVEQRTFSLSTTTAGYRLLVGILNGATSGNVS